MPNRMVGDSERDAGKPKQGEGLWKTEIRTCVEQGFRTRNFRGFTVRDVVPRCRKGWEPKVIICSSSRLAAQAVLTSTD